MELVELGPLSLQEWIGLTGHTRSPFGPDTADLVFRPKERNVGIRDDDGRLVAAGGATIVTVEVEGHGPFEVVGLGAVIVHESLRGRGLGRTLMDGLRALAERMGPDRAMIFCDAELVPLYSRRGYTNLAFPVQVDQPNGPIVMPNAAMWLPLRPSEWPAGAIRVHGLPF